MPSKKGERTDPDLYEKVKEEVKNEEKGKWSTRPYGSLILNRCLGGGKGSWSAWKAGEASRRYESQVSTRRTDIPSPQSSFELYPDIT